MILFPSVLKALGVFMTLQIKTSLESASVLIIFILPTMEGSLWDHIFNVFFEDPNLSKKVFFSDTTRSYVKCTPSAKTSSLLIYLFHGA